MNDRS